MSRAEADDAEIRMGRARVAHRRVEEKRESLRTVQDLRNDVNATRAGKSAGSDDAARGVDQEEIAAPQLG